MVVGVAGAGRWDDLRVELRQVRRIAAYGVARDAAGRVLLVRLSDRTDSPGTWLLPGGGVHQGEHPRDAVVREFREETGLDVEVVRLRDVHVDTADLPHRGISRHHERIVYDVRPVGGTWTDERRASTDRAAWFTADELADVPLARLVSAELGVAGRAPVHRPVRRRRRLAAPADPRRVQRFAAYAVATDPAGRVLLTRISMGFPGAGTWHLPGGGTDWGEAPADGVLRELVEETGQRGRIVELIGVTSMHNPRALGPEGYPIDWHGVRAIYRVAIDEPTEPVVADLGGSTSDARWYTPEELAGLRLNRLALDGLAWAGLLPDHRPQGGR